MRLTRRKFIDCAIGMCCCSTASKAASTDVKANDDSFVCLTEQLPNSLQGLPQELLDFLFDGTKPFELRPFDNPGQSMTFKPFQLMLKDDAWQSKDSLSGNTPGRIKIAVHFQDGTSEQRSQVREVASEWSATDAAPIDFVFDSDVRNHIRVRFNPRMESEAGQWSYVGRRAKRYSANEPTLMLQKSSRATILHEFGHALGLRHEQSHPLTELHWDKPAVYRYYKDRFQWDRDRVNSQIFKVYSAKYICKGAPDFDRTSVMIYPIKAEFLKSGIAVPLNDRLSAGDKACVSRMYGSS